MRLLFDTPLLRRTVTVTAVFLTFVTVTILAPLILLTALTIDVVRRASSGKPLMALRMVSFGWLYLLGEVWGLLFLALTAPPSQSRSSRMTYRLQSAWAAWNFRAVRTLFDLDFSARGTELISPGPAIILSRHASLIDTLLPTWFVARPTGLRLRYVLKNELLWDPALDIAGSRLPNHFVDRGAADATHDLEAIRALASNLTARDAVLIYPEGTRFSEEKRQRYVSRYANRTGALSDIAIDFRNVLPPRPKGTLAILEGSDADVLILAHRGLEGFARVKDIWEGGIVGSRIDVLFRRVNRAEIPTDRSDRALWLFEAWRDIDVWVGGEEPVPDMA